VIVILFISLAIFAVIPFVLAALLVHSLWKEIGIIDNGALNFWLPVLLVFASFQFGFFKFVKTLYGSTQSLVFAGVAIFAFLITAKIRHRVGSFGYSGIFSGLFGYALDAVGVGIFFGGVTGALTGGRMGPWVYTAFFGPYPYVSEPLIFYFKSDIIRKHFVFCGYIIVYIDYQGVWSSFYY